MTATTWTQQALPGMRARVSRRRARSRARRAVWSPAPRFLPVVPAQQVHITAAQLEATEEAIAYHGDDIVEAAYEREACPLRVWRMLLDAGLAKVDEGGVVTRYARFEDEGLWAVEIPRPNASRWLRLTLGNGSRLMLPRATLVVDEYYGYEAGDRIVYGDGNVDNCRPENLRVAPAPDPSQPGLPWERWLWRGRRLREAWGAVA